MEELFYKIYLKNNEKTFIFAIRIYKQETVKIISIFKNTLGVALLIPFAASAQNVGIGTTTPDVSSVLDISSTNKGLLIPRISLANRPVSPATGLMIYQTDNTPGFYTYNGTAWNRVLTTANTIPGTVVSVLPLKGYVNSIAPNSNSLVFAGPTVTVTITDASQKLVGSIGAPLGLNTANSGGIEIGLCYKSATGDITNFVGFSYSLVQMSTDRKLYTASATVSGLLPGTYTVGLGIRNLTTSTINNNDFLNGYVMQIN